MEFHQLVINKLSEHLRLVAHCEPNDDQEKHLLIQFETRSDIVHI